MKEIIEQILSILLVIVILWFNFSIINIIITIYRTKKTDKSLVLCLNSLGKIFYFILTILYLVGFFGGFIAMVNGYISDKITTAQIGLQIAALISVIYAYFISGIVLVGKKYMMIGRVTIDYRKLKKVNYTHDNHVTFVYAQHDYGFSTRFVDKTRLKKLISR